MASKSLGWALRRGEGQDQRRAFRAVSLPADACWEFERMDVALVVAHPNERARMILPPETKRNLAQDLA